MLHIVNAYMMPVGLLLILAVTVYIVHSNGCDRFCERKSDTGNDGPLETAEVVDPRPLILVVDDSAVARARLSRLLSASGFRVVLADDGIEAQKAIADEVPDLLITDLEMPNMDGFDLIAVVHGAMETESLPIIAITGHDVLQAHVQDLAGVFGIFKKPWNDRELVRHAKALVLLSTKIASAEAPSL